MNVELESIFQQYKTVNPNITEEMFNTTYEKYGDEYISVVENELKKKRPIDREWESEFNDWDTTIADGLTDIAEPDTRERVYSSFGERARPYISIFGYHSRNAFYGLAIDRCGFFWYRKFTD